MTVRHDLEGLVAGPPGRRCSRSNQSTPILEAAPSSSSRQPRLHGRKRHNVLNSPPIEPCRRPLPKDDDPGIRRRIPKRGPSLRDGYHPLQHALGRIRRIAAQIRNHGAAVDFTDTRTPSAASPDADADRAVTSGLPWNAWVQAHEPRVSDEVVVSREVTDNLSCEERRAHTVQAIRVIDANPKHHRPLGTRRMVKNPSAPGTFKYGHPLGRIEICPFERSNCPPSTAADS
jgi:hypothetical protein